MAARRLGLVDVIAIGVNAIVGSGVFSLPDDMQRSMGGFSPLSYLLCALVLIPVALCFAELSSQSDKNGGPYIYARRAFGARVGFIVGWACYLNAFISFAANATQFIEFAGLGQSALFRPAVISTVVALGAINYVGIRPGAFVVNLMTVGKLVAIIAFAAVALMSLDPSRLGGALPHGTAGVANGVYLALFPLQGFEVVPVPAGETDNPRRNVPIATVGSLVFAALLFVVVQTAIVGAYPMVAADSATPLVDAARYLGPTLGLLVLVGSIVSVGGFTAGSALGTPRYGQAMAEDGELPAAMGRVHPRYGTPHVAIIVTTLLTAILGALFTYRELVTFSNVTVVFQYAVTCIAVPVLRRRATEGEKASGFRVPFGLVIPAIGAIGSLSLLYGADWKELGLAAGGIALGFAVRTISTRVVSSPSS
ncbi:MAG: amino acid permease [Myxococcales bacterium]|nr:amino acid permease [Myxococcales bacterium]